MNVQCLMSTMFNENMEVLPWGSGKNYWILNVGSATEKCTVLLLLLLP